MKRSKLCIIVGSVLLVTVFLLVWFVRIINEQSRRAELHTLDLISGRLEIQLEAGGPLPTNWQELSNSLSYSNSQIYGLTPLSKSYAFLSKPYLHIHVKTSLVFLVRSKPCRPPRDTDGRWVLATSSNRVWRNWFPENHLPAEIRSQLTNQSK
jgi:hypothetical protein